MSKMGDPMKDEKEAREKCLEILGPYCLEQCRNIASLFDRPTYNLDPNNKVGSVPSF